jgi:hypothetical protein
MATPERSDLEKRQCHAISIVGVEASRPIAFASIRRPTRIHISRESQAASHTQRGDQTVVASSLHSRSALHRNRAARTIASVCSPTSMPTSAMPRMRWLALGRPARSDRRQLAHARSCVGFVRTIHRRMARPTVPRFATSTDVYVEGRGKASASAKSTPAHRVPLTAPAELSPTPYAGTSPSSIRVEGGIADG